MSHKSSPHWASRASVDLGRACQRFRAEHQIRRVPVVDGSEVVGVISQADVALELDNATAGEVVEQISK